MIEPSSSCADWSSTGGLILSNDEEFSQIHSANKITNNNNIANTSNNNKNNINHTNNNSSEKFSGIISPDLFTNSTTGEKDKKNWFNMNSFQKLSNQNSIAGERVMNVIRVLADLLTTPNIPYPLYVGLFNKTCPGIRTTHLNKLADEISNSTRPTTEPRLQPTYLLLLFPCVSATFLGLVLGLSINWVFGLVFSMSTNVLLLLMIGIILYRGKFQTSSRAVYTSQKLARFVDTLELFLQILFCYPKDSDLISKPITPLSLLINLSDYSSANHLSLGIVEKIWEAVENKYFILLTRLQSSCKITESEGRFKAICCMPTFVLVILFMVAVFTNATLLSIYRQNEIEMFTNTTILPIFVVMTCIVFLGFFAILPLMSKSFMVLLKSPARPLKMLRTSSTSLDYKSVDALVKEELEKVCLVISAFEAYQAKEQIRIFIMINTTDTCNRQLLANCIYQVQNLTMLRTTVPIVSILAADFQTLVTDWSILTPISSITGVGGSGGADINFYQQFSDSFHLIHSTFHLPVYLDECFNCLPPSFDNSQGNRYVSNEIFCLRGGSSFESLNMAITGSKSSPYPVIPSSATPYNQSGGMTGGPAGSGSGSGATRLLLASSSYPHGTGPQHTNRMHQHTTRLVNSTSSINIGRPVTTAVVANNKLSNYEYQMNNLKKIQQMFLAKSEITELNNKIIKQLLITATFFEKILRLNKVEYNWDMIVDWVTLCLHWPFRINWMLCYLISEEMSSHPPSRMSQNPPLDTDTPTSAANIHTPPRNAQSSTTIDTAPNKTSHHTNNNEHHCNQRENLVEKIFRVLENKMIDIVTHNSALQNSGNSTNINAIPPVVSPISTIDRDFLLLSQDDKSSDILLRAVSIDNTGSILSSDDIQLFAYHSCFINPYFHGVIKDHLNERAPNYSSKQFSQVQTPEIPIKSEENIHDIDDNVEMEEEEEEVVREIEDEEEEEEEEDEDEDGLKTPVAVRKCFTKLKACMKCTELSQMHKKEVISLLTYIDTIEPTNLATYQQRLLELNVTGLVLSICDLDNLQRELQMKFGDWQIFKALILYLRELESMKQMITFSDSEELIRPSTATAYSPRTFDNLAFWNEQQQDSIHKHYSEHDDEQDDEEFLEDEQTKSAASSICANSQSTKDTVPIIKEHTKHILKKKSANEQTNVRNKKPIDKATKKRKSKLKMKSESMEEGDHKKKAAFINNTNNDTHNSNVCNNQTMRKKTRQMSKSPPNKQFKNQGRNDQKVEHRRSYHDGYNYEDAPNPLYLQSMSESADRFPTKISNTTTTTGLTTSRKSPNNSKSGHHHHHQHLLFSNPSRSGPHAPPGTYQLPPTAALIIPPPPHPPSHNPLLIDNNNNNSNYNYHHQLPSSTNHHYSNVNTNQHQDISSNDESTQQIHNHGKQQCTCDYWFTFGKEKIPLARVINESPFHYMTASTELINQSHDDDDDDEEYEDNDDDDDDQIGQLINNNSSNLIGINDNNLEYSEDEQNPRFHYVLPDSVHAYRTNRS